MVSELQGITSEVLHATAQSSSQLMTDMGGDMSLSTSLRKLICSRRTLLALFSINLVCLGALLLFTFDLNASPRQSPSHAQSAYARWKVIRENFDSYQMQRSKQDALIQTKNGRGQQMDAVVGFDAMEHAVNDSKAQIKNRDDEARRRFEQVQQSINEPLDFVPPIPEFSELDLVPYLKQSLVDEHLTLPDKKYNYKIVILTPVCDVAHLLEAYVDALCKLSYPSELVSVYFGEDSSSDRTYDMAVLSADDLVKKCGFKNASAFKFETAGGVHGAWGDVHLRTSQYKRRSHLARARNMLLKKGLSRGSFDYVLWIDSDVKILPKDLIQQLLYADSDVTVPSCLFQDGRFKKIFDKNSWRETPTSIADQKRLPADILLVEGYSHTYRLYLPDLKPEGRIVPLDGVGGCVLLIKAECHRKGVSFPEEVYSHHIETEGLAKLANNMGFSVNGLPWLEVFHT